MEITFNYFARQYVNIKHEFIKATLSTSKETYHHRLCRLVRDHDIALTAKLKLDEENTQISFLYERKLGKNGL